MKRLLLLLVPGLVATGIASLVQESESSFEAQIRLAQNPTDPLNGEFSQLVHDLLEKWNVPGVSVGIIDGDHTWLKGYGLANVSSGTGVTPETLFYGCSTTKAFTAAAAAHLVDSGKFKNPSYPQLAVDWKTPIAEVLPDDFVLQDKWATSHLTLEDALTHRSGMARHDWAYGGFNATVRDVVRGMRYLPLNEPPRTKWQYCNMMYITVSHAIETLTSRWLGDVLRDWIWAPLGMNATFWDLEDARAAGEEVAVGYYWDLDSKSFKEMPYMSMREVSGAGAIISNVVDYCKWIRALIYEDKFLSKNVHDTIKAPRIFVSSSPEYYDAPEAYSLGWITSTYKGHRFWVHDGGSDSFGTDVTFFPDLKFGVVTLANAAYTGNAIGEVLTFKLIDDKLGVPQQERSDWVKKWDQKIDGVYSHNRKAVEILFPDLPKQISAPALPLENYTGTYFNPGWRNTTITLLEGPVSGRRKPKAQLGVERSDATWKLSGELEHVTGEYWILYSCFSTLPVAPLNFSPVEFKIGPDGKVTGLEIEFENSPKGKGDGLTIFEKIA